MGRLYFFADDRDLYLFFSEVLELLRVVVRIV